MRLISKYRLVKFGVLQEAHRLKHLFYTGGWKKFEPVWNFMIKTRGLNNMLPILESVLSEVKINNLPNNNLIQPSIPNRSDVPR